MHYLKNKSKEELLQMINNHCQDTLFSAMGVEFIDLDKNSVSAKMPVDKRTVQRYRILHGGASAALAESVASVAGWLHIDEDKQMIVGVEINANHLRPVKEGEGFVIAKATPAKIGKKIHVWEIKITDDKDKLICTSRCTLAVIDKIK